MLTKCCLLSVYTLLIIKNKELERIDDTEIKEREALQIKSEFVVIFVFATSPQ